MLCTYVLPPRRMYTATFPEALEERDRPECDARESQAVPTRQRPVPLAPVTVLYILLQHTGCDTVALKSKVLAIALQIR